MTDYTDLLVDVPEHPTRRELENSAEVIAGELSESCDRASERIYAVIKVIQAHEVNEGVRQSRIEDLEAEAKELVDTQVAEMLAMTAERDEWQAKAGDYQAARDVADWWRKECQSVRRERDEWKAKAEDLEAEAIVLKARVKNEQAECAELEQALHVQALAQESETRRADEWKAKAEERDEYAGPVTNPTRLQFAEMVIQSERTGRELQTQYEGSPTWYEFGLTPPDALRLAPVMRYYRVWLADGRPAVITSDIPFPPFSEWTDRWEDSVQRSVAHIRDFSEEVSDDNG